MVYTLLLGAWDGKLNAFPEPSAQEHPGEWSSALPGALVENIL